MSIINFRMYLHFSFFCNYSTLQLAVFNLTLFSVMFPFLFMMQEMHAQHLQCFVPNNKQAETKYRFAGIKGLVTKFSISHHYWLNWKKNTREQITLQIKIMILTFTVKINATLIARMLIINISMFVLCSGDVLQLLSIILKLTK